VIAVSDWSIVNFLNRRFGSIKNYFSFYSKSEKRPKRELRFKTAVRKDFVVVDRGLSWFYGGYVEMWQI